MKYIQRVELGHFYDQVTISLPTSAIVMGIQVDRFESFGGHYEERLFLDVMMMANGSGYIDFTIIAVPVGRNIVKPLGDYIGAVNWKGIPHYFFTGPKNSCNRPTNDSFHYITSDRPKT